MACSIVPVRAALLCLLLGACQRVPLGDLPGDDEQTTSDTGDSAAEVTEGQVDGGGGGGNNGPEFECEPGDDDSCSAGQKCTAISNGGAQNLFTCVPDDSTILPDDDCTPAQGTGQDGCPTGHACLTSKPDDVTGRCIPLCRNDDDCEPGACETSPYTLTTFCADSCDPLVPDCPAGLACRQTDDRFVCGMNIAETDIGVPGDSCDLGLLRGCAENLMCMPYALVAGCAYAACCTDVCDLTLEEDPCPSPSLCGSPFAQPAPGFESLGACFVPQ